MIYIKRVIFILVVFLQLLSLSIFTFAEDETPYGSVWASMYEFQENIEIYSPDVNKYLTNFYSQYPEMEFYFGGYKGNSLNNHNSLTFTYINKEVKYEDIHTAKNNEEIYDIILRAILYCDEGVNIVLYEEADLEGIINDILKKQPLASMGYSGFSSSGFHSGLTNHYIYHIDLKYTIENKLLLEYKLATEDLARDIVCNNVARSMPDYLKEKVIHDYICNNSEYSYDNGELAYLPYNLLKNGKGVCSAYTLSMQIMLNMCGIESLYVSGRGNEENHSWNIVNIYGEYYHLDTTWDDPVNQYGIDETVYTYFNVTDEVMSKNHKWDRGKYPQCNSTTYNSDNVNKQYDFFKNNNKYTDYYNKEELPSIYTRYKPLNANVVVPSPEDYAMSNEIYFDKDFYYFTVYVLCILIYVIKRTKK